MDQQTQNQANTADETLSTEEVSAIVKRYGEQQGGEASPRVSDVAEALQVDRSVVTRLLQDIRSANTEQQLRDRLDRLEREHEQLRNRAETTDSDVSNMFGSAHWSGRRDRRVNRLSLMALGLAAAMAVMFSEKGGHMSSTSPVPKIAIALVIILILLRRLKSGRASF